MFGLIRSCLVALAVILLAGCGGGSGGGSTGSGNGGSGGSSSTLSLSTSNVTISAAQWGAQPEFSDVTATLSGSAVGLAVSFAPSANAADWLVVETEDGARADQIVIKFNTNTTSLSPGDYTTRLRVTSGDASGAALDNRDINLTLRVAEGVPIELSPSELEVTYVRNSIDPVTRTVTVSAEGDWNATSQNNNFSFTPSSGNGSGEIELTFTPNNITRETDALIVTDADSSDNEAQTQITLKPVAEISSSKSELTFEGFSGGEAETDTISITALDEVVDWNLTADQPWISFSSTSGQTDAEVVVTANPSNLDPGTYTATLTLTEPTANQSKTINVTFEVAPKQLVPSSRGLLLNSFPSSGKLNAEIIIANNAGGESNWAASSNQAWLTVTPTGITGDALTMTADPNLIELDSFSRATILVSSSDPAITDDVEIQVGFWRGSADPTSIIEEIPEAYTLAIDPVRPFAYVAFDEDSFGIDRIDTYNIYTGLKTDTVINPMINPGKMTVSDNGAFLYVTDGNGGADSTIVERIDLSTGLSLNQWPLPAADTFERNTQNEIHFARVEGIPAVYSAVGAVLHAETGVVLGQYSGSGIFTVSQNGRTICFDTTSVSPNSSTCTTLDVNGLSTGNISITPNRTTESPFNTLNFGTDIDLSPDGETVYIADQFDFKRANVDDFIYLAGGFNIDPFVQDVEVAQNGEIFILYENFDRGINAIRRFTPDGATIATNFTTEGIIFQDTLVISGDGSRTAVTTFDSDNTEDNFWRLEFVTVE